jgi:flavin-dependent dehydrogenase
VARDLSCEIVVVGGGPAGCTAARRLAQLGHDVCLLERRKFPRPHVGEALSGGVRAQLEFLGVAGEVERANFLRFDSAELSWSMDGFEHKPMNPKGFTVDRAPFDQILLNAAQHAGVRAVQPAVARKIERFPPCWHIGAETNQESISIRARFVVDASGRAGFLPRRRIETSPRTLALYGYWRGARLPATPRIEAGALQWYWGSPVPGGRYNAMVFLDRNMRRAGRATLLQHYHALIGASDMFAGVDAAELESSVLSCDATSFEDRHCFGESFLKIGEAAFAIDPLSSSGVQAAIQSALAASVAVHTVLSKPAATPVAQSFYAQHVRHAAAQHAAWAAQNYREHRRYSEEVFWQRRAKVSEASDVPVASGVSRQDWRKDDRVAISPDVKIQNVPCVVGDFVELRPAVSHRALSRPVAFICGLDLPAFLHKMPPASTISEMEQALSPVLPEQDIPKVLDWLFEHGLLQTEPSEQSWAALLPTHALQRSGS